MKKILVFVTVAVFCVMISFVSFAKQKISESELDSVSAQEGVQIDFGAFNLPTDTGGLKVYDFLPAVQSWGDADGFGSYTTAGWVGMTQTFTSGATFIGVGNKMTIDVGSSGAQTAVQIGLPQAILHTAGTTTIFRLDTAKTLNGTQPSLGSHFNDQFAIVLNPAAALGGTAKMTITNNTGGGEGVNVAFSGTNVFSGGGVGLDGSGVLLGIPNTTIMQSWGDADGFGTYSTAGYFGTVDTTLANGGGGYNNMLWILLSGAMTIDVGSSGTDTAVNIGLPTINISTSGITQTLALSTGYGLGVYGGNQQRLGTSYMGGVRATITPGTMTISAHGP